MGAAFVQGAKVEGGTATSATISLTGTTAGNLLVLCFSGGENSTASPPQVSAITGGSTYQRPASLLFTQAAGAQTGFQICYCFSAAGGSESITVSFNGQSVFYAMSLLEYSGVQSSSDPLDQHGTNSGNTTAPTSATIPGNSELVIAMFGEGDISSTWTDPAGWNVREENQSSGNFDMAAIDKLAASGSTTASWTGLSSAAAWASVIASFKLATGAAADNLGWLPHRWRFEEEPEEVIYNL
jgi:hypothetical protein